MNLRITWGLQKYVREWALCVLQAMKTYHEYHEDSQLAENKLLRVQSQRVKEDQNRSISRRFRKDYEKESERVKVDHLLRKVLFLTVLTSVHVI